MITANDTVAPSRVFNPGGKGPVVLAVDHASNRIPAQFDGLGLTAIERLRHIAWDPGALEVALRLSALLDAPVVASSVSRLVVDCNRSPAAGDLCPPLSEHTEIPGNREISDAERAARIAAWHTPFHQMLADTLAARPEAALVTVHSFTPVFKGVQRIWPLGILPGPDEAFSHKLQQALLAADPALPLGWNEPYRSGQDVTYTLDHHGRGRRATMLEIRHDEILTPPGIARWAGRIGAALQAVL